MDICIPPPDKCAKTDKSPSGEKPYCASTVPRSIDGQEYDKFESKDLIVRLPNTKESVKVKVRIAPTK